MPIPSSASSASPLAVPHAGTTPTATPAPVPGATTVLIAALGGQGGGVLSDWIAHAARAEGRVAQATSTPGVSQRTGATTYYLELAPPVAAGARTPVLGLTPVPGRVDVLVCAELLEVARMLERGMATPDRTVVVASTHRVYTTREKIAGGDGRYDGARIQEAVRALSRRSVLFDMDAVRARHRAAISAALFGALAGSGALGLGRAACEDAIREAGIGVKESLAAFGEAYDTARIDGGAEPRAEARARPGRAEPEPKPAPEPARLPEVLAARALNLPRSVAEVAALGAAQCLAYQDADYAARYLTRVEQLVRSEAARPGPASEHVVTREAARGLARWMCYEDVAQVATLKARRSRLARIRREVQAGPRDVVRVTDFFKPGAAEIAAVLPPSLGRWLQARVAARPRGAAARGLSVNTSSPAGALMLRLVGSLRRWRPRSLRFQEEQAGIERWLARLEAALTVAAPAAPRADPALDLARLPQVLKGYGETHAAGRERFEQGLAASMGREAGGGSGGDGGSDSGGASPSRRTVVWLTRR